MAALLNIGADIGKFKGVVSMQNVLDVLGYSKIVYQSIAKAVGPDEATFVVSLAKAPSDEKIMLASVLLGQDCIAIRYPDGSGKLIGPAAAEWGDFNPEFFVLEDGSRAA